MKIKIQKKMQPAFSLLEVMIAIGIFFLGSFAILGLVSQSLSNAQRLQHPIVDASAILSELTLTMTNQSVEGHYSGGLDEMLGKDYAGYTYQGDVIEMGTNHLYVADYYIYGPKDTHTPIARTATLIFDSMAAPGSLDGGNFIHR